MPVFTSYDILNPEARETMLIPRIIRQAATHMASSRPHPLFGGFIGLYSGTTSSFLLSFLSVTGLRSSVDWVNSLLSCLLTALAAMIA